AGDGDAGGGVFRVEAARPGGVGDAVPVRRVVQQGVYQQRHQDEQAGDEDVEGDAADQFGPGPLGARRLGAPPAAGDDAGGHGEQPAGADGQADPGAGPQHQGG